MAITQSGLYPQTWIYSIDGGTANAMDYTNVATNCALILDAAAPLFTDTTPYFTAGGTEKDNEATGTGYVADGSALNGKTLTITGTGTLEMNATDHTWATSTIANAMAAVIFDISNTNNDMICLLDFVTAVSSDGGTFTVDFPANGFVRIPEV